MRGSCGPRIPKIERNIMLNFNPNSGKDQNGGNNTPIPTNPAGAGAGGPYPWSQEPTGEFDPNDYMINYNERFKNEAPIMFRDSVILQTLSCLIGKFKPNALLIGAAGTGKTKIVEDIARRIAVGDTLIPDQLQGYTIWELPLSNIVAGSGIVGDVEQKTKNILAYAEDPKNKVILFIDEIHMLIGESPTYDKIAQIMKPALARGALKAIGATTLQESQSLMDDPAFNRRFTRLIVDELSKEQTAAIIKQMQIPMFEHYDKKIAITDKVIDEIVATADEYKTVGSHRPDNAITLLDRSMADAYIRRKSLEAQAANDPSIAAALQAMPVTPLSKAQMVETARKLITGNNEKTEIDYALLRQHLSVIKGQDEVLDYLIDALERADLKVSLKDSHKPFTLLFAGNSGVGKTEVAKIIAREITNTKPIILNMTEYHSSASINRIIGSPAGYIGSDSKGELPFDILESNPYQVILLDEFEKSDASVQKLFMSAFEEGEIKTARGKIIDFSRSIIIATTNAGHTSASNSMGFVQSDKSSLGSTVTTLSHYFPPELLNRFTKILNFNPITKDLFREIVKDTYHRQVAYIKDQRSAYVFLADDLDDATVETITNDNYVKEFGARPVNGAVQKYIEDTILAAKHSKANAAAAGNQSDDAENNGIATE